MSNVSIDALERELDRKITKGRKDIKEGKFTPVNTKTAADFTERLSNKLVTKPTSEWVNDPPNEK